MREIKVAFCSGSEDLWPEFIEHMKQIRPDLPLIVVSEFPIPGEDCLPWHIARSLPRCCSSNATGFTTRPPVLNTVSSLTRIRCYSPFLVLTTNSPSPNDRTVPVNTRFPLGHKLSRMLLPVLSGLTIGHRGIASRK